LCTNPLDLRARIIKYGWDLAYRTVPYGTKRPIRVPGMTKEDLERMVEEFLKSEIEDPEVREMLVSLEGD